jgi:hypothetical protein
MKVDPNMLKDRILKGAQPILEQLLETQKQVQEKLDEVSRTLREIPCHKLACMDKLLDSEMANRVKDRLGDNAMVKQGLAMGQNLKHALVGGDSEEVAELKERLARLEERLASMEGDSGARAQVQRLAKKLDQLQARVAQEKPRTPAKPKTDK